MGLTRRRDSYYVEFPVLDDGKTLTLARGVPGAKLKRWKVGSPNRTVAKQQEAKIKTDLMMGLVSSERLSGPVAFKALTEAYLADPKIQRQGIYQKKQRWIEQRFLSLFGPHTPLDTITTEQIEAYLEARRKDRGYQGTTLKTATLNRELAALKHLFGWAVRKQLLKINPAQPIQQEKEHNVRDVILEPEQFERLQTCSPPYLRTINLVAYHTGMRQGEILNLKWDRVDLKGGFLRLKSEDTKTKEGRSIPLSLSSDLFEVLRTLAKTRALHNPHVFLYGDRTILSVKDAFRRACREAKIFNFRFHDFRHTAITNMRRAGIDRLTIMEISGHKTMVCFSRYNSFRDSDLEAAARQFNTYITRTHRTPTQGASDPVQQTVSSC